MKISAPPLRKARIEIIPMIDTIFFLLVFFMFSALSMVRMRGVNLALPRTGQAAASTATPGARPPTLIVTVTPTRDYYLNTSRIGSGQLIGAIRARIASMPGAVVVLNVAGTEDTQTLINLMDMVNRVRTPAGEPVKTLIATEPVDLNGRPTAAASGGEPDKSYRVGNPRAR